MRLTISILLAVAVLLGLQFAGGRWTLSTHEASIPQLGSASGDARAGAVPAPRLEPRSRAHGSERKATQNVAATRQGAVQGVPPPLGEQVALALAPGLKSANVETFLAGTGSKLVLVRQALGADGTVEVRAAVLPDERTGVPDRSAGSKEDLQRFLDANAPDRCIWIRLESSVKSPFSGLLERGGRASDGFVGYLVLSATTSTTIWEQRSRLSDNEGGTRKKRITISMAPDGSGSASVRLGDTQEFDSRNGSEN